MCTVSEEHAVSYVIDGNHLMCEASMFPWAPPIQSSNFDHNAFGVLRVRSAAGINVSLTDLLGCVIALNQALSVMLYVHDRSHNQSSRSALLERHGRNHEDGGTSDISIANERS